MTVEVPDNKWRPDPDDLRSAPPVPPIQDTYARPPSPAQSAPRFYPYESPEVLEEITENLRNRVENWHGLDFNRYGSAHLLTILYAPAIYTGGKEAQFRNLALI